MADAAKFCMLVRVPGDKPKRLFPGEKLSVGREPGNDIVLRNGSVSRKHAEIVWDSDEDRPYILDLDSANGVEVDGDFIEPQAYLTGGNSVLVGDFTLAFELRSVGSGRFLNEKSDEAVTLFADKGKQLKGDCETTEEIRQLLVQLETDTRTGTLILTHKRDRYEAMFSMGKVVLATSGDKTGVEALLHIAELSSASYHFSKQVRPVESTEILSVIKVMEDELEIDTRRMVKRPK